MNDLYVKKDANRAKVWEMMLGCWTEEEVNFSLFVDEIAFEGQAEASSRPAPATPAPAPAAPLPKDVDARDPAIRYLGRWDMTNPSAPRASWTYSLVTAKFQGTAINARLKGGGYYQVVVDGQPTRVIDPKDGRIIYEVAKDLPNGEHVVEIVRRNEGNWIDPITFLGFQLESGGKLLPLPPRSERRMLIVGDSISCGYGNEAARDEHNPLDKENGYMTFGAIAARSLGAELQIVAWSGRKLYPNNTMVELYDRTLAMEKHAQGRPDGLGAGRGAYRSGHERFRRPPEPARREGLDRGLQGFHQDDPDRRAPMPTSSWPPVRWAPRRSGSSGPRRSSPTSRRPATTTSPTCPFPRRTSTATASAAIGTPTSRRTPRWPTA